MEFESIDNYNSLDIQDNTNYSVKARASKNVKVRTFSNSLWYVALVRTNCEQKTGDAIDQFDSEHRANVWLPIQKAIDRKGRETYKLDIHGYVFFHLPKQDERNSKTRYETLKKVRCISYVRGLLTDPMTQGPAQIPNSQVQRLKDMLNDSHYPTTLTTEMVHKGTRVKVISGSLAGIEGTVEDISKEKSQIFIAFDCLGCAVTVIDTSLVVPVDVDRDEKQEKDERKQVSIEDWLALHPYREALSDDKLYVNFANSLMKTLESPRMSIPLVKRKRLALSLTSYIEDKRTRLGAFAYFVEMRYKSLLHPVQAFFPESSDIDKIKEYMADYDAKNVNVIDLMYFLQNNDNGKPHSLNSVRLRAQLLFEELEKLGYAQLPSNTFYTTNLGNMLQDNAPWKGLKRLIAWLVQRLEFYSFGTFQSPVPQHVFCRYPESSGRGPLSLALQLSKRLKARIAITRKIEYMLNATATGYEVVGCYRKAIHLMDANGKKHIVYLDEISGNSFAEGEHYECKLVELEKDKWYMVEPPLKEQVE